MFSEHVKVFDNLFTDSEVQDLYTAIADIPEESVYEYSNLGRLHNEEVILPQNIQDRLTNLVNSHLGVNYLSIKLNPISVEYRTEYGSPHLPPHFDRDDTDYILDYQLESNTQWPLGVDRNVYPLEDNSAVGFNPNGNIHWRPLKTFQPGEYVRMIFFRFHNHDNPSDYKHLPENIGEPEFVDVNDFRSSLGEI
jgi:hypothetical protein